MGGWNPWAELRRRSHVRLRWARMPRGTTGYLTIAGEEAIVTIDAGLDQRTRNATLAHELVHEERRVPTIGVPPELAAKEEAAVDRIVAGRLVPQVELGHYIARRLDVGDPVTPADVAEHFDVPLEVACRALGLRAAREAAGGKAS